MKTSKIRPIQLSRILLALAPLTLLACGNSVTQTGGSTAGIGGEGGSGGQGSGGTAGMGGGSTGCGPGVALCGDTCVDTVHDPLNCGACSIACAAGEVCSMGACALQCSGGSTQCGASCVNTQNDPANCGSCGKTCAAGEVCSMGACALQCSGGSTQCGASCVDVENDPANCGVCGNACFPGNVCTNGACVLQCSGGSTLCGQKCVNTQNDPANCGVCGNACAPGNVCSNGACALQCSGGTTLCGQTCTNTSFDPANCGTCGNVCPGAVNSSPVCTAGSCATVCQSGFGDCNANGNDGCETNVQTSASHCGSCGSACPTLANATTLCNNGTCSLGACDQGFSNCDQNTLNGCETNTQTSDANCGMCGVACPMGEKCSAGACVPAQFSFAMSQMIDGKTVTCSSVTNMGTYTQCNDLQVDGLYMPNGITCGPAWSTTNSSYSDTRGFCQSLTGSMSFEVYYNCTSTTTRATWFNHVWGTFQDNGYTQHVRCYY